MHLKSVIGLIVIAALNCFCFVSAFSFPAFISSRNVRISQHHFDSSLFSKKIICSFDGTACNARNQNPDKQEGNTGKKKRAFTNVLKLHLLAGGAIDDSKGNHFTGQVCLYQRGIGGITEKEWLKTVRFALGFVERQIEPMIKKLEAVYEPGDTVYVTGFSRGCASARKFALRLNKKGIKTKDGERKKGIPIEFLGCFDTVSLQIWKHIPRVLFNGFSKRPTKSTVVGEDGKIAPNVKKAVHLVSLDDNRQYFPSLRQFALPFPPVLMGHEERVHEVWFPGVHGDVGGNFYDNGLSDGACLYMQECMKKEGIEFVKNATEISDESRTMFDGEKVSASVKLEIHANVTDEDHIEEGSNRPVIVFKDDKEFTGAVVNIHESVFDRLEKLGGNYTINPLLHEANFRVVGNQGDKLGEEIEDKTVKLRDILNKRFGNSQKV